MVYVEPEIQEQIIKLHIVEGRTYKSLCDEFGLSYAVVKRIVTNYREHAKASEIQAKQLADMEELNRLKAEVAELRKENDFLKKAAAFFAKESKQTNTISSTSSTKDLE